MPVFRLERAADWPGPLHAAADTYERAVLTIGTVTDAAAMEIAIDALSVAKTRFGREMLALDRRRRPEIYAK